MLTLAMNFDARHFVPESSYVMPKYDGIRCAIGELRTVSNKAGRTVLTRTSTRSGGFVPNDYARKLLDELPYGLDGELVLRDTEAASGEAQFSSTMSALSAHSGQPDFCYVVYDYFGAAEATWLERMALVKQLIEPFSSYAQVAHYEPVDDLEQQVAALVAKGYEGAIVRQGELEHKPGRCNGSYAACMRIKAMADCEARIVAVVPDIWSDCASNRKLRPELIGQPKDIAASFECEGLTGTPFAGQRFRAPLSVPDEVAREYLASANQLTGQLCKVRYLAAGTLRKPRQPICIGIRADYDHVR